LAEGSQQGGYRVVALDRHHDRTAFSCGVEALDRYLRAQAGQDARKRVAAPFVLCAGDSHAVLGYYTLSALSIDVGDWPDDIARKLPRYPVVPATLLGRLAVEVSLRGKSMGEYLLMDALRRALLGSRQIASVAVIVDAKDDGAVTFYKRYDFTPFVGHPSRMFLPMGTIEKLFT
jgi:predicted N-acetyltransferase YhbS